MSMTTYDKVRAKIVELVPEIVELKFGCEVRVREKLDTCTHHAPATVIYSQSFPKEVVVRGVFIGKDRGKDAVRVPTEQISKIIGRPITLEDVLRAIHTTHEYPDRPNQPNVSIAIDDLVNIHWHLGKPLEEQSEETVAFIGKTLNV